MADVKLYEKAQALCIVNKEDGISLLKKLICEQDIAENDEELITAKEQGILQLAEIYREEGKAKELLDLMKKIRPFLKVVSKAKSAKLVRFLLDLFLDMDTQIALKVDVCKDCVAWAKQEKRNFLRQSLEVRLVALYLDAAKYSDALKLSSELLKEVTKIDDKHLLMEVQLLESKIYFALDNLTKARAALTSARTMGNSIYCPQKVQADLDLQSGILYAADQRDFKTAFSYFYEAFEGFDGLDTKKALMALKYMLLCKIMSNQSKDVNHILSGKLAITYSGRDIEAMKLIAEAAHKRSLADFQLTLKEYKAELVEDAIVKKHLGTLYDNMMEENLCRIIESYNRVQIAYLADRIKLPMGQVEKKLSQMILDKKIDGILDQGEGVLIIYELDHADKTYEAVLEVIQVMGRVVDTLYQKAKKFS